MGPKKQSELLPTSNARGEEVPVVPCKGWFDACEYCDKRFCNWSPVDEDVYEKIPVKPGACIIALKNKGNTEVVSILLHDRDIQSRAVQNIDVMKEQLSSRKSKASKSEMIVRWMCAKKIDDKEVITLCAHWFNNGVLPRFSTEWPGADLLEKSSFFTFSINLQKWCHPTKNPVWKKPKDLNKNVMEGIKKCDWKGPCDSCDRMFGKWKPFTKVLEESLLPDDFGIYMLSAVSGKEREVYEIGFDKTDIKIKLNGRLDYLQQHMKYYFVRNEILKNRTCEVRWTVLKDPSSDEACHLYAHWLNVGKLPSCNDSLPGESLLSKNKRFVIRTLDKKWLTVTGSLKSAKNTKVKDKKALLDAIEDEYLCDNS